MANANRAQQITALIKSISGQANTLAIPRLFISITGDIKLAILLSQCIYWSDRTKDSQGWFYKSYPDWQDEIGLSQFEVKRAAIKLVSAGLIKTKLKRANGAPTMHYWVNFNALSNAIMKFLDNRETSLSRNLIIDNEESSQSDNGDSSQSDNEESQQSLTEITSEITSETTTETTSSSNEPENFGQAEGQEEEVDTEGDDDWEDEDLEDPEEPPKTLEQQILDIGIFPNLLPEIMASRDRSEEIRALLNWVKTQYAEDPESIPKLFLWRIRNQVLPPLEFYGEPCPSCGQYGKHDGRRCNQRYLEAEFAAHIEH